MDWNTLLFLVFPYVALSLAIVVTIYRSILRPFSLSSLSSQLLERRLLYWGSIPFHWGVTIILAFHLIAIFIPQSIVLWNAQPLRLYILEISGLGLGLWATFGMVMLVIRRVSVARIRAVSTPMDYVVLLLVLVSLVTGVAIASFYRWGSYWFTAIFTPYILGLLTLHPNPAPLAPLPLLIKVHVFNFFLLTLAFSFSRLVHIITWPLGYLLRPWQIVVALRSPRPVGR